MANIQNIIHLWTILELIYPYRPWKVGTMFCAKLLKSSNKMPILKNTVLGEPQLGKRGLYPTLSTKESGMQARTMMNYAFSYCDGHHSLSGDRRID